MNQSPVEYQGPDPKKTLAHRPFNHSSGWRVFALVVVHPAGLFFKWWLRAEVPHWLADWRWGRSGGASSNRAIDSDQPNGTRRSARATRFSILKNQWPSDLSINKATTSSPNQRGRATHKEPRRAHLVSCRAIGGRSHTQAVQHHGGVQLLHQLARLWLWIGVKVITNCYACRLKRPTPRTH